jgi:hypothetical protein
MGESIEENTFRNKNFWGIFAPQNPHTSQKPFPGFI